jgi:hypothetical protein
MQIVSNLDDQNIKFSMNHDYSHCSDYKRDICPSECFRGKLVQDLINKPWLQYVSFASFKNSSECPLKKGDS